MEFISARTQQDCECIHQLAEEIWHEHYSALIGVEQVRYMLDTVHSCAAIEQQIRDGMCYEIIQKDGTDCAYVAYADHGDHCFLSKLYVRAAQRGQGIGSAAVERVCAFARAQGLPCVRLGVNKGNDASIAMYQGRGFRLLEDICIDIGGGYVMDDHLMQLDL